MAEAKGGAGDVRQWRGAAASPGGRLMRGWRRKDAAVVKARGGAGGSRRRRRCHRLAGRRISEGGGGDEVSVKVSCCRGGAVPMTSSEYRGCSRGGG
jgi:hypothetical protein